MQLRPFSGRAHVHIRKGSRGSPGTDWIKSCATLLLKRAWKTLNTPATPQLTSFLMAAILLGGASRIWFTAQLLSHRKSGNDKFEAQSCRLHFLDYTAMGPWKGHLTFNATSEYVLAHVEIRGEQLTGWTMEIWPLQLRRTKQPQKTTATWELAGPS